MDWETDLRYFLTRALRRLRIESAPTPPYQRDAFPENYRSLVSPSSAARDLIWLECVKRSGRDAADLRPPVGSGEGAHYDLRMYSAKQRALDEILPTLQNLGLRVFDQIQFNVTLDRRYFIRSFLVEADAGEGDNLFLFRKALLRALDAALSSQAEDDSLNRLILPTGLSWRDVDLFRAYRNYYLQLGRRFGRLRVHRALLSNVEVAKLLHRYFEARFAPDERWRNQDQREGEALTPIRLELSAALDKVADVNEDRILRDFFNLIDATLRTNFYRRRDQHDNYIALKISSLGVLNMPSPRPMVEIYVHSPKMEGVHLRGAKVARGGIRWSDRPDDFRSEILDLMQTQTVKNALIVPQGAKGGFVLKTSPVDAKQRSRLAQDAYATFMRGLLDLTDNARGSQVVHPPGILSYDDFDPYLVVAADKGTAAWSDRANEIAAEYGFWLGDAFATGGSHGYHHKRLGITARGAWVCVRRHFLELGQDIDREPFTVVGVGSMDGDVFGNGMLQSDNIRLLGAFNAQHIFLDPNPDRLTSFAERKRLFATPNSTWRDYDPALISPGGGVFSRSAKDIPLSADVRAWLGARNRSIDGEGLIRLLLTAPVDLLWMGGVGTYVKASFERDESVGDRANDGARVDAVQLRAKVVGEGANLGFTQSARTEYALGGGRINTDAVDNSGGVDLSDHEVNLKILFSVSQSDHSITGDDDERNQYLSALTGDVCGLVLANNYTQSLCLSLERKRCVEDVGAFMDLADLLENVGLLDRAVESFPSRKEALARGGQGLTRPELAVLMAYSKLALKRTLLDAPKFLDGEWTRDFLAAYFPERVRSDYGERLNAHPLSREIAASVICNKIIDQAGGAFLLWTPELDSGARLDAVGLYLAFDQILQGQKWRDAVCALDGRVAADRQYEFLLQMESALAFLCRWALERGRRLLPQKDVIARWRADLAQYLEYFNESLEFDVAASIAPDALRRLFYDRLRDFPMLAELSRTSRKAMRLVIRDFDHIVELLGLRPVATLLRELKARDPWERRLQASLDERFRSAAARLALMELRSGSQEHTIFFRRLGMESRLARLQRMRAELIDASPGALSPFAAFGAELDTFVDACAAAGEPD